MAAGAFQFSHVKMLKTVRITKYSSPYILVDVVVTAAVIAILVSVSKEPVDDFLVLTPLTLLLSITAEVLSGGGGKALVLTVNNKKQDRPVNGKQ